MVTERLITHKRRQENDASVSGYAFRFLVDGGCPILYRGIHHDSEVWLDDRYVNKKVLNMTVMVETVTPPERGLLEIDIKLTGYSHYAGYRTSASQPVCG